MAPIPTASVAVAKKVKAGVRPKLRVANRRSCPIVAGAVRKPVERMKIEDSTVDLVTSSMLVSQFAHEPYTYFSQRTAERLGRPSDEEEAGLLPALEALCDALLEYQVQAHFDEIDRILAPGGVCYLSFELFHTVPGRRQWFLVDGVPLFFQALADRYYFNFDALLSDDMVTRFQTGNEPSLVFTALLEPKKSDG